MWEGGSEINYGYAKLAYVERYAGSIHYFRNLTILIFVVWLLVMSIFYSLVG